LKVEHLLNATKEMAELVEGRTNGLDKMRIKIDKGDSIDTAYIYFEFTKKPLYFNYEIFGYLHRKNRIDFSYKLTKYN